MIHLEKQLAHLVHLTVWRDPLVIITPEPHIYSAPR